MRPLELAEPQRGTFGARYSVINRLGRGSGGDVHRVLDRLTGRVVTLKSLRPPRDADPDLDSLSLRQEFVREFRILSTLRHPNVISVLDFGFSDGQPWFTMELQEHARPLLDAARGRSVAMQLDLVVQLLRALHYVHGRGVLHRDIKPDNVVVVNEVVKLLDFGLWAEVGGWRDRDVSGTLAWMAPEVLHGASASPASDLYAVGLILLAMQLGRPPYDPSSGIVPITSGDAIELVGQATPLLQPLLERFLARTPEARFVSAAEALAACAGLFSPPANLETVATRESVLGHAPLVGREPELATLDRAIEDARAGRGGVLLVGGESGVGKSRLVAELRTRALVRGFVAVTGEALHHGGDPFHVWRDVVRLLTLERVLDPRHRELLARLDPWLRDDEPAAAPDPGSASDAFAAVERLFDDVSEPLLVLLEDLQWASPVSIDLLRYLLPVLSRRPVLVAGTFREDERPGLAEAVNGAPVLHLARLGEADVARLVTHVLGRPPSAALVAYLCAQTEGLPFFLVEVLRDLAARAGTLALVDGGPLPPSLATDGMRRVLRKRLERLGAPAVAALETAAVAGRRIDVDLVRALHPQLDLEAWVATCAHASVLAARAEDWVFDHDKLRELLVDDLPPERRTALHRQVAEHLEERAVGSRELAIQLVWHWRGAGDPARESVWAERAGMQALEAGASQEALGLLRRARELTNAPAAHPPRPGGALVPAERFAITAEATRVARLERAMAQAAYLAGDLPACRTHALRALVALGARPPAGTAALFAAVLYEAAVRVLQVVVGRRPRPEACPDAVLADAAAAYTLHTEASFYAHEASQVLWSTLGQVNLTAPHGPSAALAESWVLLGLLLGMTPGLDLGGSLRQRAWRMATELASTGAQGKMQNRLAVYHLGLAEFEAAAERLAAAGRLAQEHGDRRLLEESQAMQGLVPFYLGRWDEACATWEVCLDRARQSGNRQVELWLHLARGDVAARRFRLDDARAIFRRAEALIMPDASRTEEVWLYGSWSLVELEAGDEARAVELARRSLDVSHGRLPIAYWPQPGIAACAETVLRVAARDPAAVAADLRRTRSVLRIYALTFPHARPGRLLWEGLAQAFEGRPGRARRWLRSALAEAERRGMRFEAACAHRELAALERPGSRAHQRAAAALFDELGCAPERSNPLLHRTH